MLRLLSKTLVLASILALICIVPALADDIAEPGIDRLDVAPETIMMNNAKLPKTDLFSYSNLLQSAVGGSVVAFDELVKTAANSCIVIRVSSETAAIDDGDNSLGQDWSASVDGAYIFGIDFFEPSGPGRLDTFSGTWMGCGYGAGFHNVKVFATAFDPGDRVNVEYRTMEVAHK